jgi:hypothetical protein
MISLETAQALKDAGLGWNPHAGDYYYRVYDQGFGHYDKYPQLVDGKNYIDFMANNVYHALSLSQLLAEIEARGYVWALRHSGSYEISICPWGDISKTKTFKAKSPDEAAAQALLWIIEQEKGE